MARVKVFVGIDWGDSLHTLSVLNDSGQFLARFQIKHLASELNSLPEKLKGFGSVQGVCIETPTHLLIPVLLEANFKVYAVNPKITKRWQECFKVTPSKTDELDADSLAKGLQLFHKDLKPLNPLTSEISLLRDLCRDEMVLIQNRTALLLQLKSCLKTYFPGALAWFRDWSRKSALEFLITFSTPKALAKASKSKLQKFLGARKIGFTREYWQQRIAERKKVLDWKVEAALIRCKSLLAVTIAKQLLVLGRQLEEYRATINETFSDHSLSSVFSSFPGAGEKLAPRILAEFGDERGEYKNANSLQCLAGVVPVQEQTGARAVKGKRTSKRLRGKVKTEFRKQCRRSFRASMHMYAFTSTRHSKWAQAYYKMARARGQSSGTALRNLAAKWLKIMYRCWKNEVAYDESLYLASLTKRGSPVIAYMKKLEQESSSK